GRRGGAGPAARRSHGGAEDRRRHAGRLRVTAGFRFVPLFTVEPQAAGKRLDQMLHGEMPEFSRSRIPNWIKTGRVVGDGSAARASYVARTGDRISVEPSEPPPLHASPEAIPLVVLYEDADLVAIDKPAGMVVHAGAGVRSGTLVNALLHRFGALSG